MPAVIRTMRGDDIFKTQEHAKKFANLLELNNKKLLLPPRAGTDAFRPQSTDEQRESFRLDSNLAFYVQETMPTQSCDICVEIDERLFSRVVFPALHEEEPVPRSLSPSKDHQKQQTRSASKTNGKNHITGQKTEHKARRGLQRQKKQRQLVVYPEQLPRAQKKTSPHKTE